MNLDEMAEKASHYFNIVCIFCLSFFSILVVFSVIMGVHEHRVKSQIDRGEYKYANSPGIHTPKPKIRGTVLLGLVSLALGMLVLAIWLPYTGV